METITIATRIIQDIQTKGFNIFGIQSFVLTKKEVEDFYEIYKGIVSMYAFSFGH